jgi:enoyl-CoA hydratase/carnithine racemase
VFQFMRALIGCSKPVIAAVSGAAIGIGTTLLLHCDLVVASTRSRLQMPFVNLGLVPEFASSLLLPARIGPQRAAELLMLAESMDAATAMTFGLVNRVVEPEEVDAAAMDYARRLAAKPPEAIRESKRLMRADPEQVARRMEQEDEIFGRLLSSPEAREAFSAFLEKRTPDFSKLA